MPFRGLIPLYGQAIQSWQRRGAGICRLSRDNHIPLRMANNNTQLSSSPAGAGLLSDHLCFISSHLGCRKLKGVFSACTFTSRYLLPDECMMSAALLAPTSYSGSHENAGGER